MGFTPLIIKRILTTFCMKALGRDFRLAILKKGGGASTAGECQRTITLTPPRDIQGGPSVKYLKSKWHHWGWNMVHVRQSIRDKAVITITGLSITGTNVFRSQMKSYLRLIGSRDGGIQPPWSNKGYWPHSRLRDGGLCKILIELLCCVAICECTDGHFVPFQFLIELH